MRLRPRSLLPRRISSQIAFMIVMSLIVVHTILSIGMFLDHREQNRLHGAAAELGPLVQLIDSTEPPLRPRLMSSMHRIYPKLDVALAAVEPTNGRGRNKDRRTDDLRNFLGADFRVAAFAPQADADGPADDRIAVHLRDGQVVTARIPVESKWSFNPLPAGLLSIAIIMTMLGLWAARALTAPLRAFANAAEAFSPDAAIAPLPESGPDEIRTAARALNRMRARVKSLVEDRVRMLAAVGHDLRTPITRLRLCSEFVEDAPLRGQMMDVLDGMNAMIEQVLTYLREGRSPEDAAVIDVAISLRTICDHFTDIGREVSYDGPDRFAIRARPAALRRAITNLVDNAVRYGDRVRVSLTAEPEALILAIEDEGPGIPDHQKEAMFEPFVGGDAARSMDEQSGFGLGLSIARAAVAAHGGTLILLDRQPTGLIARIDLPVSMQGAPQRFPDMGASRGIGQPITAAARGVADARYNR